MSLTFPNLPFWLGEHAAAQASGQDRYAAACIDRMAFVVAEQLCQAAADERPQTLTKLKDMVVAEQLPTALMTKLATAIYEAPDGLHFQIIPEVVRTSVHLNEDRDLDCLQKLVDAGCDVSTAFTGCVPHIERASVLHAAAVNHDVAPNLVVRLVEWGADLHAMTPCGRTPADLASAALNGTVSELLRTFLARDACRRAILDNEQPSSAIDP